MITAVDTSVLLDVFLADPKHGPASAEAIRSCLSQGSLVVCEVVWAETAAVFDREEDFVERMSRLAIRLMPSTMSALWLAGQRWRAFRAGGGRRDRVVADFMIAANASKQCDRLLTRDRDFALACFDGLVLIDPSRG